MDKQKKIYFEVMRIIAVSLVIFHHTNGYVLWLTTDGIMHYVYEVLTMLTRVNVPLFLMITGSLLLSREEEYAVVLKKRISRFIAVLLIFDIGLYTLSYCKMIFGGNEAGEFVFKDLIKGMISGTISFSGSYWYLYAYLGMLCVLPFLQRMVKGMKKADFICLLMLHFLFSSLVPIMNCILADTEFGVLELSPNFNVPLAVLKVLFYPVMGYYVENKVDISKLTAKHICALLFGAVAGVSAAIICTEIEASRVGRYSETYVQLFDYVTTIVTFVLIKYIFVKVQDRLASVVKKGICLIGSLTFGIYLLDPYLKETVYLKYHKMMFGNIPGLIFALGWVLISITLGGLITLILKKLPIFRKLI